MKNWKKHTFGVAQMLKANALDEAIKINLAKIGFEI